MGDVCGEVGVEFGVFGDGVHVPCGLGAGCAGEGEGGDAVFAGFGGGADGAGDEDCGAEVGWGGEMELDVRSHGSGLTSDVGACDGDVWRAAEEFGREGLDAVAHGCDWESGDIVRPEVLRKERRPAYELT